MSKCRLIEDHESRKVSDNTIKKVVYEVGVGFYGTHPTSWYFFNNRYKLLTIDNATKWGGSTSALNQHCSSITMRFI
jgi:hypothetical protein